MWLCCHANDYKPSECTAVTSIAKHKGILMTKKFCFNCTGPYHRSAECKSTATCQQCKRRHHTSICVKTKGLKPEGVMTAHPHSGEGVIYPVIIEIDGIKTHTLLDTGRGSSYALAKLIEALNKTLKEAKTKRTNMMLGSTTMKIEIYSATLNAIDSDFKMNIEVSKVQKPQLTISLHW